MRPLSISGFTERRPEVNLVQVWDTSMGLRLTDINATSLRISLQGYEAVVRPSTFTALDDLARWTALSNEQLGFVLGASRRSIYNWRQRTMASGDASARILQAYSKLQPISQRWAPALLKSWLDEGDPSPLELLHEQRWEEFDQRVAIELEPKSAPDVTGVEVDQHEPEAYGPETRSAMLHAFSAGSTPAPRRSHWHPRELTGIGEYEKDDE